MAADHTLAVQRAIAEAGSRGETTSSIDWVCTAAVELLSLKGAGVSLMVDGQLRGATGGSDPRIALMQELHLSLGEGPCHDVWETRASVIESDLSAAGSVRWPMFAPPAAEERISAVFAFPMALGAIRIGVLLVYRERTGGLSGEEFRNGLVLANVATNMVLSLQAGAPSDELHGMLAREPPHWAEIHQATGMVSVQLGVSLDEAFVRLRAYTFAQGLSLREVASQVVDRRLRLEPA